MAFAGFSALARHSGAIFLRRSFREDEVYKLVLRHFIDYLVKKRAPLSWSIEGTRSRTGRLMPPKLGLLQWVIDACHRAVSDDALLIPVTISYDQIPEIDDYIAMQRGLPKQKESLRWFVDYIAGMQANYGKIYVRFAEPVTLSTPVEIPREMLPADADRARVQELAYEVCSRIEHAKPINATDVISLVMLGANNRRLSAETIAARAGEIADLVGERSLPQAGDLRTATGAELPATLETLCTTGLLDRLETAEATDYGITPGKELAAAYYRNTVAHYFLSNAIAEVALAASRPDAPETSVQEEALALRGLLKFEFFFKAPGPFLDDVNTYLDARWPGWRAGKADMETQAPPLFGPGILRSFAEAYSVLARLLVASDTQGAAEDTDLVSSCLRRGEALLEEGAISTGAALSQPIFETGLELARHRQLLDEDSDLCVSRREAFADELERVLTAINRLQHFEDGRSTDAVEDTGHARRSIA
jgi:glycerol-3-phosphate O-acyltransferase